MPEQHKLSWRQPLRLSDSVRRTSASAVASGQCKAHTPMSYATRGGLGFFSSPHSPHPAGCASPAPFPAPDRC